MRKIRPNKTRAVRTEMDFILCDINFEIFFIGQLKINFEAMAIVATLILRRLV